MYFNIWFYFIFATKLWNYLPFHIHLATIQSFHEQYS